MTRFERRDADGLCPHCLGIFSDEPYDRKIHRRRHQRLNLVLEPKPDTRLEPNALIELGLSSPLWQQRLLADIAWVGKKEMDWMCDGWDELRDFGSPPDGYPVHGFLFTDERCAAVGGCLFIKRRYTDQSEAWQLYFVWIRPASRRQGIFTRQLPALLERFGMIEPDMEMPPALEAFLRKHGLPINQSRVEYWQEPRRYRSRHSPPTWSSAQQT